MAGLVPAMIFLPSNLVILAAGDALAE